MLSVQERVASNEQTAEIFSVGLSEHFRNQAKKTPDGIAVRLGEESLSYRCLDERVDALAARLIHLGVAPGETIGVWDIRTPEMIVALLGILRAGGAYLPLAVDDPKARLGDILKENSVRWVVGSDRGQSPLDVGQFGADLVEIPTDRETKLPMFPHCNGESLAYVMYTSGSTGVPKGVEVLQRGVIRLVMAEQIYCFCESDVVLQMAPLSFDASTLEVWGALLYGATLVLAPTGKPDLESFSCLVQDEGISNLWLTSPFFKQVMETTPETFSGVSQLIVGGDIVPVAAVNEFLRRFNTCRLINGYGPTENTTFSCCFEISLRSHYDQSIPIGRSIGLSTSYVLDEQQRLVDAGAEGELWVGGAGLARGYRNDPELTQERFVKLPVGPEGELRRLYRTGDVVRMTADGVLEFIGRVDKQVKIRGYRLQLEEVEHHLRRCLRVRECALHLVDDSGGNKSLAAFVVAALEAESVCSQRVDAWRDIYDEQIYDGLSSATDPLFNTTGWSSRITGLPIPAPQMREWAADIVDRILECGPRRVLEIGCGTGLLTFQIAPHCEHYVGWDFSQVAIDHLQQQIGIEAPRFDHVDVSLREANDFSDLAEARFDVIILSSVVQYFPNVEYLLEVIQGALNVLQPGGVLFFGDVRNLNLMKLSHFAELRDGLAEGVDGDAVLRAVEESVMSERELLIAPEFFECLGHQREDLAAPVIQLQRGSETNELNQYRYHVILEKTGGIERVGKARQVVLRWGVDFHTLDDMHSRLTAGRSSSIRFERIRNRRLDGVLRRWAEAQARVQPTSAGLDPHDVFQLADSVGGMVEICWSVDSLEGDFDVLFSFGNSAKPEKTKNLLSSNRRRQAPVRAWDAYVNRPLVVERQVDWAEEIRQELTEFLPAYAIPTDFIFLDQMPTHASGKTDWPALRRQATDRSMLERYEAPRNETETQLGLVVAQELGLGQVSVVDDFFVLGGHSLIATRIAYRIREWFEVDFRVRDLLRCRSVRSMAERVDALNRSKAVDSFPHTCDLPELVPDPERRNDSFPLTDVQQAYWLGRNDSIELGGVGAHLYFEMEKDELDIDRLTSAWGQLIRRHEMLRAVIRDDGQQAILETTPAYKIVVQDVSADSDMAQEASILSTRERMSHQVHNPGHWPLFEICAHRLGGRRIRLHFSLDALIFDIRSLGILLMELDVLYADLSASLPPLNVSFRDYLLTERKLKQRAHYERARQYWLERLDCLPTAPKLPLLSSGRDPNGTRFKTRVFRLPARIWVEVKAQARQRGVTVSGALLSLYSQLLAAWSRERAFTINVTLFNRVPLHPDVDSVVGDFTSLTLLGVDLNDQDDFLSTTQSVQEQLWADLEHRWFSGVEVIREIGRQGKGDSRVKMPVVFTSAIDVIEDTERGDDTFSEAAWSYVVSQSPQVWLDNNVLEQGGELLVMWDFVESLFPEGMVDSMFDAYCRCVEDLAKPESWLRTFDSLDFVDRGFLKSLDPSSPPLATSPTRSLYSPFLEKASIHDDRIGVLSGERQITYGQLAGAAKSVAQKIKNGGIAREGVVAIVMDKGWEQIVSALGILLAGCTYLPIDINLPRRRQELLLSQGKPSLVLTNRESSANKFDGINTIRIEESILSPNASVTSEQAALAYIIFTSGTTGVPKGVMTDHQGPLNTLLDLNDRYQIDDQDCVLALSSLSFDLSVYDIFGILAVGGTVVLPESERQRDPLHWLELMRTHDVTIWNTVPALMEMLLTQLESGMIEVPPRLRLVFLSGDWISPSLPKRLATFWPNVHLVSLGGATEASIWSIAHDVPLDHPESERIPYGRPMRGQSVYVLNRQLDPCPPQVPGDIYLGGIGLAKGYWNDEEKTTASFLTHPRSKERLYRTGDMGRYRVDGCIEILGREDTQVKIRGHRIELGEIEATMEAHPLVNRAVVVVEGDGVRRRLIAYVAVGQNVAMSSQYLSQSQWAALRVAGSSTAKSVGERFMLSDSDVNTHWGDLDRFYEWSVVCAFEDLGIWQRLGERRTLEEALEESGIVPRYRRWLQRALDCLVAQGWLKHESEAYTATKPIRLLDRNDWESLKDRLRANSLAEKTAVNWLSDSAKQLALILREEVHSGEVYLASGVKDLYQDFFVQCHTTAKAVAEAMAHHANAKQPLRVLEVGAGYGTLTRHLLPLLDEKCEYYYFTDLSDFFLRRAATEFKQYPFIRYHHFDLNEDLEKQGFGEGEFDLIVAASVLHAGASMSQSLRGVRRLLKRGGVLLAIEETNYFPWYDLGMGLQQGIDSFRDLSLRPKHPLLTREQWGDQLSLFGFGNVEVIHHEGSLASHLGLDVILATTGGEASLDAAALNEFVRERLPEALVPSETHLVSEMPLSQNGKVDREALAGLVELPSTAPSESSSNWTRTQSRVAQIWARVLETTCDDVKRNFFDAGGDSLQLTQIAADLSREWTRPVPVTALFEHTSIEAMAAYLDKEETLPARDAISRRAQRQLRALSGEKGGGC